MEITYTLVTVVMCAWLMSLTSEAFVDKPHLRNEHNELYQKVFLPSADDFGMYITVYVSVIG
jgi:hypothetical protein